MVFVMPMVLVMLMVLVMIMVRCAGRRASALPTGWELRPCAQLHRGNQKEGELSRRHGCWVVSAGKWQDGGHVRCVSNKNHKESYSQPHR